MDWKTLLVGLVPVVGSDVITRTVKELDSLTDDTSEPWKKTVLSLIGDAVEHVGPDGLELARKTLNDILDGKAPDIDWANPRTASDIIAHLQNAEADRRSAVSAFVTKIGKVLGLVFGSFIKGALAAL